MERTELIHLEDDRPDFYWAQDSQIGNGKIVAIRSMDGLRMIHEPVSRAWFEVLRDAVKEVEARNVPFHGDDDKFTRLWHAMTPMPLYIDSGAAAALGRLAHQIGTVPTLTARRLTAALDAKFNERGDKNVAFAAAAVATATLNDTTLYEPAARFVNDETIPCQTIDFEAFSELCDPSVRDTVLRLAEQERPKRLPLRHTVHPDEWNNPHDAATH